MVGTIASFHTVYAVVIGMGVTVVRKYYFVSVIVSIKNFR